MASKQQEQPKPSSKPGLIKTTIAGGVGGACLVLVGHPLDTVKVRLQTMQIVPGEAPPYKGAIDCVIKTCKAEGFLGLYRGMAAPLYGVTPMYALCFFGYGIGQKIFCDENTYKNLNLVAIGLAGGTSGLFTTPILAPLERLKCTLQIQAQVKDGPKFKGPLDLAKHLYGTGGLPGLSRVNRGFCGTMLRDSIGSVFYFSSYEYMKSILTPEGKSGPSTLGVLTAGGIAGIMNWLPAMPIDSLKSKLQVAPDGRYPHGIRSVFREVLKTDGFFSLYRGFGAVMLRAFPANAACFLGYETAIKVLNYIAP